MPRRRSAAATGTGSEGERRTSRPGAAPKDPFSAAVAMLARRAYSIAELRRALERKFPSNPSVEEAVARLRQLGYLDDRKFAEQTAYSLVHNRAMGPHRVRRELKAKRVNYKYIDDAVSGAFKDTDPKQLLEKALDRKIRSMKLPVTQRKLSSLCQSLLRRGFSSGDIIKVVRSRPELKPAADEGPLDELGVSS